MPADGEHIWRWFCELTVARGSNGWGPNPLSYQDIAAWVALTGTITRPEEVKAIMLLDRIWMAEQAKAKAKP